MTDASSADWIELVDVDILDLDDDGFDDDDDFVFEPTAWDLAFAIGLEPDPETDRPALDELADAMLVWMHGPRLEALTSAAVEAIWEDELEGMIRSGLQQLRGKEEWRAGAEAALIELAREPRAAEVSREVVRYLAQQLSNLDTPVFFCVDCLADAIRAAELPEERRQLALRAAIVARRDAAAACDETERRRAVRRRLGRLADFGRESVPSLARELQRVADEPLPAKPEDDDAWAVVEAARLAEVMRPELN
jgi:hypothetical protein